MRKLLLQRNILILIGVLIFAVTVFAGARMYRHWTTSYYFGKIVAIQNGGFYIQSNDGIKTTVITNQYTVIKKVRGAMRGALEIGNDVIVIGLLDEKGRIKAELIRVVSNRPR